MKKEKENTIENNEICISNDEIMQTNKSKYAYLHVLTCYIDQETFH